MGLAVSCTSSRDSPALETTEPQRSYRPTPTSRDMNNQSSTTNRKVNIEERPNDPANQPPEVRSQRVLPGRQPVVVDTTSTRARRDTTHRKKQ
ncbi:hypothetical protein [Rufibacter sp. LB8]|uniref:hypothetical protein n=1 Tax=Rufibacter sp. LB8 TaxID=2777781 RepID=UPI00178C5740|nr:hypothetical protein [Rufibacter sp. LB8]